MSKENYMTTTTTSNNDNKIVIQHWKEVPVANPIGDQMCLNGEKSLSEFFQIASVPLRIKYKPGAHKLEKNERGDWIDMYTYENTFIPKNKFVILDLGVAIELPQGYEGILAPRSSTFKRWGLLQANSIGIFDETYCGNDDIWGMPVVALREDVFIPKNTRLCQFRIFKHQPLINFVEVDDLGNKNRGGWGSSGA